MFPRGGKRQKGIDTPNQAKARSKGVYDRIDWFLQLIKIFYASKSRKDYLDEANLLLPDGFRNIKNFNDKFDYIYSSLENYKDEFLYFKNFEGFCDCFKLVGSLVDREYNVVEMTKFFPILPENYEEYIENLCSAIEARNERLHLPYDELLRGEDMEKVCFSDENVNETEGLEFFYNEMLSNVDENGKEEVFDRDNGYTSSMICEF